MVRPTVREEFPLNLQFDAMEGQWYPATSLSLVCIDAGQQSHAALHQYN